MLSYIQLSRRMISFCYFIFKQQRKPSNFSSFPLPLVSNTLVKAKLFTTLEPKKTNCSALSLCRQVSRNQKNRESNFEEDSDSDESDEEDDDYDKIKGVDVNSYRVKTLRVDSFLKVVFKYSKKQIEEEFYKNRIRLNEKIFKKKSTQVKVGDLIDLVLKVDPQNPKFIYVNRVEILKITDDPDSDAIFVKVQKSKSLLIENYLGNNTLQNVIPEKVKNQ